MIIIFLLFGLTLFSDSTRTKWIGNSFYGEIAPILEEKVTENAILFVQTEDDYYSTKSKNLHSMCVTSSDLNSGFVDICGILLRKKLITGLNSFCLCLP